MNDTREPQGPRDLATLELVTDLEDSVGLAIEGAFERFAKRGPRVLKLRGGAFAVVGSPRFEV